MVGQERLADALRAGGLRVTRQRQLVWKVLQKSQDHLDAEGLHDLAKAHDANISLATVYRTLAVLKEAGLVEEHWLGEDHAHFEVVPETPHYHFTCLVCGKVLEFDAPQVAQVVHTLSKQEGLEVKDVHLFVSGTCAECRKKGGTKANGH